MSFCTAASSLSRFSSRYLFSVSNERSGICTGERFTACSVADLAVSKTAVKPFPDELKRIKSKSVNKPIPLSAQSLSSCRCCFLLPNTDGKSNPPPTLPGIIPLLPKPVRQTSGSISEIPSSSLIIFSASENVVITLSFSPGNPSLVAYAITPPVILTPNVSVLFSPSFISLFSVR